LQITHLTKDNFRLFAVSHYDNPYCLNEKEFEADLGIVLRIKKALGSHDSNYSPLNSHVLLNCIISFYNVFSIYGATKILEYRIEEKHHNIINAVLFYLNYPLIGDEVVDANVYTSLQSLFTKT
jgi:hypothetical protein